MPVQRRDRDNSKKRTLIVDKELYAFADTVASALPGKQAKELGGLRAPGQR